MLLATCLTALALSQGVVGIVGDYFGTSVAAAGDVDADGVPDIVVASGSRFEPPPDDPAAYVFSGRTGERLLTLGRGIAIDGFENRYVSGMGDANVDGHADVALAGWRELGGERACCITTFSGSDGSEMWVTRIEPSYHRVALARIGDVDGDGTTDLCAASLPLDLAGSGHLETLSGRSGCTLAALDEGPGPWRWAGPPVCVGDLDRDGSAEILFAVQVRKEREPVNAAFEARSTTDLALVRRFDVPNCGGPRCGAAGDVDRDGIPDILVAGFVFDPDANYPEFMRILSGRDGTWISEFMSVPCNNLKRIEICGVGDVDRDGWRDVLFSEYGTWGSCAGVRLLSGRDARPIRQFCPKKDPWGGPGGLGYALADAGDVDQDGIADLVMSAAIPWGDPLGYVDVYSGSSGARIHRWSREHIAAKDVGSGR